MGFGKAATREKNPVMLVIGKDGSDNDAKSVDLLLRDSGSGASGDWGLVVGSSTKVDAEALSKDGCQFVLIESDDAGLITVPAGTRLVIRMSDTLDSKRHSVNSAPTCLLQHSPLLSSFH